MPVMRKANFAVIALTRTAISVPFCRITLSVKKQENFSKIALDTYVPTRHISFYTFEDTYG